MYRFDLLTLRWAAVAQHGTPPSLRCARAAVDARNPPLHADARTDAQHTRTRAHAETGTLAQAPYADTWA